MFTFWLARQATSPPMPTYFFQNRKSPLKLGYPPPLMVCGM
jgi:hypothetical protein